MASAHAFEAVPAPLTALTEEESMFRDAVRQFAGSEVGPFVREMDESAHLRPEVLSKFFELGLMSIEIPEQYGGQGGTFFQAVLAVEELAAVDPAVSVVVDV